MESYWKGSNFKASAARIVPSTHCNISRLIGFQQHRIQYVVMPTILNTNKNNESTAILSASI